jgi:hypothetical protein
MSDSDTPSERMPAANAPDEGAEHGRAYEPPRLVVMGTFEELTQLKISGSSDFVNFQPSHP